MTECSAPHGNKTGRGCSQMNERRSEDVGWYSNVKEVRKIQRGEVVDSFECQREYFVVDTMCNRMSMELL